MNAMIFAAGLGTRLGAITSAKPKALVEVGGEPMLSRVILKLKNAGVSRMVVNVHHLADAIVCYLKANDNFGIDIRISDERALLLDTGGGLLKARPFFDSNEPIVVHNADILTDFDISRMLDSHIESKADATLLVADRRTSRYLLFDADRRMKGWKNVTTGEIRSPWPDIVSAEGIVPLAFGGVHIIKPSIFTKLERYSKSSKFSITPFYTDQCADLYIKGYTPEESFHWIDIGKPQSLIEAENIVSELRPIPLPE
ncbi:sugar phosphate nucleotidyltransferase [uncultured Duncaniella sp.]|uniref:sugar phosphate nucleotidyltransferase n=1 Tax=uncultured Duncaniella sp. TaxID=2768039 RepID=UPI00259CAF6B|nr:sugar phosphate nucleotidyltransferase [uncultured Duncaniella sp.]